MTDKICVSLHNLKIKNKAPRMSANEKILKLRLYHMSETNKQIIEELNRVHSELYLLKKEKFDPYKIIIGVSDYCFGCYFIIDYDETLVKALSRLDLSCLTSKSEQKHSLFKIFTKNEFDIHQNNWNEFHVYKSVKVRFMKTTEFINEQCPPNWMDILKIDRIRHFENIQIEEHTDDFIYQLFVSILDNN